MAFVVQKHIAKTPIVENRYEVEGENLSVVPKTMYCSPASCMYARLFAGFHYNSQLDS